MRVYQPLRADHPAVVDKETCGICKKPFCAGERTTILCVHPERVSTVQGALAHARCAFKGVNTIKGEIAWITSNDRVASFLSTRCMKVTVLRVRDMAAPLTVWTCRPGVGEGRLRV